MWDVVWQRLDYGARMSAPFLTALLCLFLGVIPLPVPYMGAITPPVILITIYYWAGHRPDIFRPSMVFILGILNDLINRFPLGFSAIIFICIYQLVLTQRRFFINQSFLILWMGFLIVAVLAQLLGWALLCFLDGHYLPILPILIQTLIVCMLFPIPCWILIQIQRSMLSQG